MKEVNKIRYIVSSVNPIFVNKKETTRKNLAVSFLL